MKRYVIFGAIGPLVAGFLLLVFGAPSGYWDKPDVIKKLFTVVLSQVPYNIFSRIIPALMIGAVDDILFHARRITPVLRMLLTGLIAFGATLVPLRNAGTENGPQALSSLWACRVYSGNNLVMAGAQNRQGCRATGSTGPIAVGEAAFRKAAAPISAPGVCL